VDGGPLTKSGLAFAPSWPRTMRQRMPAQKHNPFQNDSDRRVVASVVWWKDVTVRIVAPRRREGRSALFEVS
jgi:hypothetical protein